MAIKQKAVDGFLASLGSLTKDQALANLALDARSYRWNAETVDAIAVGIHRHYPGYDDISVPLAKISNCYESWKVAPQERKAFHAMTVQRELEAAFAALSELQAQFGDVNGGTQPRFDNEQMAETAVAAGGVLVIKNDTAKDDAIDIARQLVANGKASERMKSELDTFDQHTRIIAQAGAEGLTVHSNIHTFRVCALRWIEGEIANLATSPEASF